MISDLFLQGIPQETVEAFIAFFSVVGASFVGGICFAAYRAINWVEGIRTWAHAVWCPDPVSTEVAICGRSIDSRGTE